MSPLSVRRLYRARLDTAHLRVRDSAAPCLVRSLAVLMLALSTAGCGMSFPLGPLGATDDEPTGSIVTKAASPLSPELSGEDWRRAKSALSVALDPLGNGSSTRWDNPESGIGGSFTPVGQPFVRSDEICRAFLADLTGSNFESSLQGTACRFSGHDWAIRDLKPWKKSV